MTDVAALRQLLSDLEAALEDHSYALHTDRRAALSLEERLAVVKMSRASWQRYGVSAIQRALKVAGLEFIAENGDGAWVRLRKDW